MRKLAMEVQMPAVTFNDAGSCLGQVRQVLSAIRAQLRAEGNVTGNITISLLVKTGGEVPAENQSTANLISHERQTEGRTQ